MGEEVLVVPQPDGVVVPEGVGTGMLHRRVVDIAAEAVILIIFYLVTEHLTGRQFRRVLLVPKLGRVEVTIALPVDLVAYPGEFIPGVSP